MQINYCSLKYDKRFVVIVTIDIKIIYYIVIVNDCKCF